VRELTLEQDGRARTAEACHPWFGEISMVMFGGDVPGDDVGRDGVTRLF